MGQYTSYWLYQKYEQRGSQEPIPCYPNVYSVDGDGTMPLVVRKEEDTQCGYVPPTPDPKYRWTNIPINQDYICDDCSGYLTRWVNMDASVDYYCEGTTKYYKQKKQVSYDNGATWKDVIPYEYQKGGVAELKSWDCGYRTPIYRWFDTGESGCTGCDCDNFKYMYDNTPSQGEKMPSNQQLDCEKYVRDSKIVWGVYVYGIPTDTAVCISDKIEIISSRDKETEEYSSSCFNILFEGGYSEVVLPPKLKKIEGSFMMSHSLKNIVIPSGITELNDYLLENCNSLESVIVKSNNLTHIGTQCFNYCSRLNTLILFSTTVPTLGRDVFSHGASDRLKIYVPSSALNAYKAAWGDLSNKIYSIN